MSVFRRVFLILLVLAGLASAGYALWRVPDIQARTAALIDRFSPSATPIPTQVGPPAYRFAVLADSHENTTVFPAIIDAINRQDPAFTAHLGDTSNAGDRTALATAKTFLDRLSMPYYVLPGDHDYNWLPSRDLANFTSLYGRPTYNAMSQGGERFIFIDNSDSAHGLGDGQWGWLAEELARPDERRFVFLSTPLSNPYLPQKTMGSQNDAVKAEGRRLARALQEAGVLAIFAGDTHTYATYTDTLSGIPTITVGSAGEDKNLLPLWVLVEIFPDGRYNAVSKPLALDGQ